MHSLSKDNRAVTIEPERDRRDVELADTKRNLELLRAEVQRAANEQKRHGEAVDKDRQARIDEAVAIRKSQSDRDANAALATFADFVKVETKRNIAERSELVEAEDKAILRLIELRVTLTSEKGLDYINARTELISLWDSQANGRINEMRLTIRNRFLMTKQVEETITRFDQGLEKEIATIQSFRRTPYFDTSKRYDELKTKWLKDRQKRSELAKEWTTKYFKEAALSRNLDLDSALLVLKIIHGSYIKNTLDKNKVAQILKNRKEVLNEMALLAESPFADWMPEYLDATHDVTIGEAYAKFISIISEKK